jgi:hypothetical protein
MPKPYAKHFSRSVIRPEMPAQVKPVVDRIAEMLQTHPALRDVDREVLRLRVAYVVAPLRRTAKAPLV